MGLDFVGFKVVYKLLGHDALNNSKNHSKFILCQKKHNFTISLTISHTHTTVEKN